ncbi:hypothetical protein VYU27_003076 [Nannochloropsis oceanica]
MRRRRADSSDEEEGGNDPGIKQKTLIELREEQRQRKAKLGIQAACTFDTEDGGGYAGKKKGSTTEEEDEEEAERQRSIGEMMESSFTGMKYVKKDEMSVHERIMEQYINEKLGGTKSEAPEAVRDDLPLSKSTRRDKLLAITEEVNAQGRGPVHSKGGYANDDGGVGEGAPIAFSTGIAEVSLPMEFKLRNIEATEFARQQREEQHLLRQQQGGGKEEDIIGNVTYNYNAHRKDYAISMRARDPKPKAPFKRGDGEGPKGRDTMSDDQVYAKFKKRKY